MCGITLITPAFGATCLAGDLGRGGRTGGAGLEGGLFGRFGGFRGIPKLL